MRYVLMICSEEHTHIGLSDEDHAALMKKYVAFQEEVEATLGEPPFGARLKSIETATSVRVRDGKTLITDGPFAETRERLGGFYIVEADNLDQVIEWASRTPQARVGTIEIRPVWEPEDYMP